jgi:hypothetical protein
MGYKLFALRDVERTTEATNEARRIVGPDAVEAAKRQATRTLTGLRLSWPGMRLHRPIRLAMWASLAASAVLLFLRPTASDPATLVPLALLLGMAALAWLVTYLLPASEGDLRYVVELAAVAHVAGSSLPEEHFAQLSDGWYAVLEGRWRRGRRPYRAWGCLLTGIVAVVLVGVALEVSGAGR